MLSARVIGVSAVSTRVVQLSAPWSTTRSVALMARHTATNVPFVVQSLKTLEIFALTSMENAESSGVLSADMELNPICF
ncbi:unnamed protein product [Lepidochelys olivacea]